MAAEEERQRQDEMQAKIREARAAAEEAERQAKLADQQRREEAQKAELEALGWRGTVSTVAGSGTKGFRDGTSADAQFCWPSGVAIDGDGCLFVTDQGNNRIRKVEPDGTVSTG